jgi:2-polyprenyl-3-methyl-5-hydroxy-6-metoxy-1,4-benzoquinol methylase
MKTFLTNPESAPRPDSSGHEGPLLDRHGDFEILDCKTCGFAHATPLPSAEAMERAYAETYYAVEKPDYLVRAETDAPWANMFYEDRLSALSEALGPARICPARLLDIGSGPGHFLSFAQTCGWQVEGIEPSRQAAEYALSKGLRIHNRMFDGAWANEQTPFDAVHSMNVLEHVADPIALLAAANDVLKPGGAICVGVPNDYNALQAAARNAGQKPWWVVPPHHLNYFSFDSLERLLRRCGFTPVSRLTSFPMEAFLLMGRNYVGDDAAGRALHAERKAFDANLQSLDPAIRRRFYHALSESGFGREAVVIAVKS